MYELEKTKEVMELIEKVKSGSGVCGPKLVQAHIRLGKLFGDEFKIYLDGDSNIEVLIPSVSSSKGDFRIGENIISSNFNSSSSGNLSTIVSLGNDNIVSGSLIRVIEPKNGFFGYFIVEKDKHIYDFVHTMELQIKERTFN